MTGDLFPDTQSHAPSLQAARIALESAATKLFEAERIHEDQGPEASGMLSDAQHHYDKCQGAVIKLEREEML